MTNAFQYLNTANAQSTIYRFTDTESAYSAMQVSDIVNTETDVKDGTDKDDILLKTPNVEDIISYALQYDCVIGARAFEFNGEIVVALITTPFYLKSERDKTKSDIQAQIRQLTGYENIALTFDMGVYRSIRGELTDSDKERLLIFAKSR